MDRKKFEQAQHLLNALELAQNNPMKTAQIRRDYGMLFLSVVRNTSAALDEFDESCEILEELLATDESDEIYIEYVTSIGFRARSGLLTRQQTRLDFKFTDKILKGHHPYELNNLIWCMKTSIFLAWKLLGRALKLALYPSNRKERNWKRAGQAMSLCLPSPVRRVLYHLARFARHTSG